MERHLQIMQAVANGKRAREIAEELDLSAKTIEKYVDEAKRLHDARSSAHLVAIFLRKKLIK